MIMHSGDGYKIYFGDGGSSLKSSSLRENLQAALPLLQKQLNFENLVFLNQVHGTNGVTVSHDYKFSCPIDIPSASGDIILTNRERVGIGVLTADCLPLIFKDPEQRVLAIAHAGWRGSIEGISNRTISMMKERFSSDPKNIKVFFGPSAKHCCYEVKSDFVDKLRHLKVDPIHFVMNIHDRLFFDNVTFNKFQLLEAGILEENFNTDYNKCTICNANFCSYRRERQEADRQFTIAVLNF